MASLDLNRVAEVFDDGLEWYANSDLETQSMLAIGVAGLISSVYMVATDMGPRELVFDSIRTISDRIEDFVSAQDVPK